MMWSWDTLRIKPGVRYIVFGRIRYIILFDSYFNSFRPRIHKILTPLVLLNLVNSVISSFLILLIFNPLFPFVQALN